MTLPIPGDLPDPEIKPVSLESLALAGGFFTHWTTWKDLDVFKLLNILNVISTLYLEAHNLLYSSLHLVHDERMLFFFSFIYYLFYFTVLYWFCCMLTWIRHGCTCVPHLEPPSHLPPHPIPQGLPSAPALSTLSHALKLDWQSIPHMIRYMFQCCSLKSSHPCLLLQSPEVCSLHLCLLLSRI